MAIIFHCEHCGKKIEASEKVGGKWGKCPSCHNKIYVPNLNPDDGEELKLAPVDEKNQERQKKLMAETYKLSQDILLEREIPDDQSGPTAKAQISDKELTKQIIVYLRQMADGELNQARKAAESIIPYGQQAIKIIDQIALSEIPEPELADIPPQILAGLIRSLRGKLS